VDELQHARHNTSDDLCICGKIISIQILDAYSVKMLVSFKWFSYDPKSGLA
jgi:hypothetical protein